MPKTKLTPRMAEVLEKMAKDRPPSRTPRLIVTDYTCFIAYGNHVERDVFYELEGLDAIAQTRRYPDRSLRYEITDTGRELLAEYRDREGE